MSQKKKSIQINRTGFYLFAEEGGFPDAQLDANSLDRKLLTAEIARFAKVKVGLCTHSMLCGKSKIINKHGYIYRFGKTTRVKELLRRILTEKAISKIWDKLLIQSLQKQNDCAN